MGDNIKRPPLAEIKLSRPVQASIPKVILAPPSCPPHKETIDWAATPFIGTPPILLVHMLASQTGLQILSRRLPPSISSPGLPVCHEATRASQGCSQLDYRASDASGPSDSCPTRERAAQASAFYNLNSNINGPFSIPANYLSNLSAKNYPAPARALPPWPPRQSEIPVYKDVQPVAPISTNNAEIAVAEDIDPAALRNKNQVRSAQRKPARTGRRGRGRQRQPLGLLRFDYEYVGYSLLCSQSYFRVCARTIAFASIPSIHLGHGAIVITLSFPVSRLLRALPSHRRTLSRTRVGAHARPQK